MAAVKRHPPSAARGVRKERGAREARGSLLDAASTLLGKVLRFDKPADAVIGEFLRDHRTWGSRDREVLGDVAYAVLRQLSTMRRACGDERGGMPVAAVLGQLALLAWPEAHRARLGLDADTQTWLGSAQDRHRRLVDTDEDHDLPPWLAQRLRHQEGDGFAALAASLLEPAPLDLRVNVLKASRDEVQRGLASAGIESEPARWSPWGLRVAGKPSLASTEAWKQGMVEVQDEGSQLLAAFVDAKRGEMVADFCAGGGGKTLALGAAMAGTGRVYAIDISASRLAALTPRLERSGLRNVYAMAIDDERDPRLDRLVGKMDRVLIDAPCSGLGTLRRSPDLKWRVREGDLAAMVDRQSAILDAAARLVKPGGALVYATCSLLEAENTEVVVRLLERRRDFVVDHPGAWCRRIGGNAQGLVKDGALCLRPHLHDTDGFFAATLRREA